MRAAGDDVRLGLVVDSQRAADRVLVDQATAQESARLGAWLPEVPGEPAYFFLTSLKFSERQQIHVLLGYVFIGALKF